MKVQEEVMADEDPQQEVREQTFEGRNNRRAVNYLQDKGVGV